MRKGVIVFSLGILFLSTQAWSGGWNNTLMGCRALGLGAAFVGVADDPSAIFYNPAGLALLEDRLALSIDGFYVDPKHIYTLPNGYTAESNYTTTIPQLFLSYKTSERMSVGFGAFIPYAGGGIDWQAKDLGFPFKSSLGIISFTPNLSYQISQDLSVGFNLNFYRGYLNVRTEMIPLGLIEEDEVGSSLSFGFGLLYRPTEKLNLGFTLRAPAKMKLQGTTTAIVSAPELGQMKMKLDSATEFNLPWDVEIGFAYHLWPNFLVSFSAQYTMWSVLDKVSKTIENVPIMGTIQEEEKLNFKNILVLHSGCELRLTRGLYVRAGIGYDRSASPEKSLNFTNIDVDKISFLGGIGYQTNNISLNFAYISAQGKEREKMVMTPLGFPGLETYNLNVNILGLGITFHF